MVLMVSLGPHLTLPSCEPDFRKQWWKTSPLLSPEFFALRLEDSLVKLPLMNKGPEPSCALGVSDCACA